MSDIERRDFFAMLAIEQGVWKIVENPR